MADETVTPATPTHIIGATASRGIAVGRLVVDQDTAEYAALVGSVAEERERLQGAIATARDELAGLSARADDDLSAEVIGFQLALLEDPELVAPGEAALADGQGAQAAWRAGIGSLIDDYEAADDAYFRARAGDLRDLERRVSRALGGGPGAALADALGGPVILLTEELTPSRFLELDTTRIKGIASFLGSPTSHVAMLARARGVPLIIALSHGLDAPLQGMDGATVVLDADRGVLDLTPDAATLETARTAMAAREEADREAAKAGNEAASRAVETADGTPVSVFINAEDPADLALHDPAICEGIGLTRTEFLFGDGPAGEERQFAVYKQIVEWAAGRPVTIRTLDAGGDKPVRGVTPTGESNPFLGLRGLRLSLAEPSLFRVQLRALVRAAALGPIKIMLPMVTRPAEVTQAREILASVRAELDGHGVPTGSVPLGIMVETPAAALEADAMDADFYSIGTNDLVQYVMAAARDIAAVAHLHDPLAPSVLRLVGEVVRAGRMRGVEVSVCGEAASQPDIIPALLDAGVRVLSVPPAAVGRTKLAIASHTLEHPDE